MNQPNPHSGVVIVRRPGMHGVTPTRNGVPLSQRDLINHVEPTVHVLEGKTWQEGQLPPPPPQRVTRGLRVR